MVDLFALPVILALAAADSVSPQDEPVCVRTGALGSDAERFVGDALNVLRHCGHDPSAYRLEIRREDPSTPYFDSPSAARITSAIFWPRDGKHHAVRVNASQACELTWIWAPTAFTPWQREIIERAQQAARRSGVTWGRTDRREIRVVESREWVRVHVWIESGDRDGESDFTFDLRKDGSDVAEP